MLVVIVAVILQGNMMYAQSTSLFQCQPSSQQDGLVVTPNIPDLYFSHENAANFRNSNLTTLIPSVTYIFTIPPVSAERDCNGTVAEMQFCYQYEGNTQSQRKISAFKFLSLAQNGNEFTVDDSFTVTVSVLNSTCSNGHSSNNRRICCSETTSNDFGRLDIPSTDYVFGISVINSLLLPLTFVPRVLEYQFDQFLLSNFPTSPGGTVILTANPVRRSFPIFRFLIDSPNHFDSTERSGDYTTVDDTTRTSFTKNMSAHSPDEVSSAVLGGVVGGVTGVVLLLLIFIIIITSAVAVTRKKGSSDHQAVSVPHSQEHSVELQQNHACIKTSVIPVQANECYGITSSTTSESAADLLYTTPIEGRSLQQLSTESYNTYY